LRRVGSYLALSWGGGRFLGGDWGGDGAWWRVHCVSHPYSTALNCAII